MTTTTNTQSNFQFATKPLKILVLWRNAFQLLKNSFIKIWYIAAIAIVLDRAAPIILMKILRLPYLNNIPHQSLSYIIFLAYAAYATVFIFSFLLIHSFAKACIVYRMYLSTININVSKLQETIKYVVGKFSSIMLVEFIFFILNVTGVLLTGLSLMLFISSDGRNATPIYYYLTTFIFSLSASWLLASMLLKSYASFYQFFILFENCSGWNAIKKSCMLLKGYWWRTALVVLPIFILGISISGIFFLLSSFSIKHSIALFCATVVISSLYFYILFPPILLVQFHDLKNRKIIAIEQECQKNKTKTIFIIVATFIFIVSVFWGVSQWLHHYQSDSKVVAKKAFQEMYSKANSGDMEAQNDLGYHYSHGIGTKRDVVEGCKWYDKAAKKGDTMAMQNIAGCYYFGEGGEKNLAKAVYWYQKSADGGHFTAQYVLGILYINGEGVKKSIPQATKWLILAAKNYRQQHHRPENDLIVNSFVKYLLAAQQKLPVKFNSTLPRESVSQIKLMLGDLDQRASSSYGNKIHGLFPAINNIALFPNKAVELISPNKKHLIYNLSKENEDGTYVHQLIFRDLKQQKEKVIYTYYRSVVTQWSLQGRYVMINDRFGSDGANCIIFDSSTQSNVDIANKLKSQAIINFNIWKNHHVYITGERWLDNDRVLIKVYGYGDISPNGFTASYQYSVKSSVFKPVKFAKTRNY